MGSGEGRAQVEGAIAEIRALAAEFAEAAPPILEAALTRRLQGFLAARDGASEALTPDAAGALEDAAERAIAEGAAAAGRRLADAGIWLEPRTAPGVAPTETGWSDLVPEWVSRLLRLLDRRPPPSGAELGALDDPGHRVWVALLSAAKPLDPVLREFGLPPRPAPDLGGGHYGLQPKTAAQLDPSATLERLWARYRLLYERYRAVAAASR
jgi:hypothetical protein